MVDSKTGRIAFKLVSFEVMTAQLTEGLDPSPKGLVVGHHHALVGVDGEDRGAAALQQRQLQRDPPGGVVLSESCSFDSPREQT